ncbi:MAG: thioredoxin domain-containing protein [Cyanobacteria bacterium SID2]|nr:thioredoxin domain-containing protein [Cyanobacteria bacterium SID2]MBP0005836.1 thioredoxin domain-containing protein [Cyanobacteria bacterium SBC]
MANRLANAQSLYLRKHAENPIDWWPWCDEAIEIARREDKPIFLSIGYSSCHWCTVMEGEAFSDPQIAAYTNDNFLPIKLDREERPDLDSIYMQTLQLMVGQGGWPLNVFLIPETLVPFYGGTYFPLTPRYGRPGFLNVLQQLRQYYDTQKDKLKQIESDMLESLDRSVTIPADLEVAGDTSLFEAALLERGLYVSTKIIEPEGRAPCFPMMPYAETALRGVRFDLGEGVEPRSICQQRGFDLALGGIFDHVGGGFHRYTVDATWTVPHFEKMLYDNGQILEYLANLWRLGLCDPSFDRAVRSTVNWLKREMTAPEGYFYAAQDADSFSTSSEREPEEGTFYVWKDIQLRQHLSDREYAALADAFDIADAGNFEGSNVLQRRRGGELDDTVEAALAKLFALRYGEGADAEKPFPPARNNREAKTRKWSGRIPPVTDTKAIVAWNSLAISGLAQASIAFENRDYLALACRAADFILQHQWENGRFHRLNYEGNPSVLAQAEDYALFVKALLDLHQAGATAYLDAAVKVQAEFDESLWSVEFGGYYNTASDANGAPIVRERSYTDNATPASNGIALANLVRLALLTEDAEYLDRAEQGLKSFVRVLKKMPQACPSLVSALDWYQHATLVRTTEAEVADFAMQYCPTVALKVVTELPEGAVGVVCRGLTCLEPALDRDRMLEQIQQSQTRRS